VFTNLVSIIRFVIIQVVRIRIDFVVVLSASWLIADTTEQRINKTVSMTVSVLILYHWSCKLQIRTTWLVTNLVYVNVM
jgi:hypothetical protein